MKWQGQDLSLSTSAPEQPWPGIASPLTTAPRAEPAEWALELKKWCDIPTWSSAREGTGSGLSPWQVGQQWPGLGTGSGQGLRGHLMGTQRTRLLCKAPRAVKLPGLAPREGRVGKCQMSLEVWGTGLGWRMRFTGRRPWKVYEVMKEQQV